MTIAKQFPYRVTVAWSGEDDIYVARIPKLGGILGLNERDPAQAIRQAIDRGWEALAALTANGHPLPESDIRPRKLSGQFHVRLLPEIHASLREWAEEEELSMNVLVSHILTAATTQHTLLPKRSRVVKPRGRRQRRAA